MKVAGNDLVGIDDVSAIEFNHRVLPRRELEMDIGQTPGDLGELDGPRERNVLGGLTLNSDPMGMDTQRELASFLQLRASQSKGCIPEACGATLPA